MTLEGYPPACVEGTAVSVGNTVEPVAANTYGRAAATRGATLLLSRRRASVPGARRPFVNQARNPGMGASCEYRNPYGL